MLIGLGLGLGRMSHCTSVETVMIAHRLGDFVVNPLQVEYTSPSQFLKASGY